MGESVFEVVKQSVTAREAAELYGIAVGRGGMACCPFHDDRHPSMKVDTRFHCFGCGADGDVIDFTARLYDLSPKGAAEKLAQDFGLHSTMFKYMDSTEVTGGEILGGKTGYTEEAGLCLASLAQVNGKEYILVTAKANGTHQTEQFHILDAINVYSQIGEAGQNTYE